MHKEVIRLKEMVLNAVLNKEALPGRNEPVMFPDLALLLDQSSIYILDKDIKNSSDLKSVNKPIWIITEDLLVQEANKTGKIIYLQIIQDEPEKDIVVLTVASKVISTSNRQSYTLSSMQFKFKKIEENWKLVEYPTSMSA